MLIPRKEYIVELDYDYKDVIKKLTINIISRYTTIKKHFLPHTHILKTRFSPTHTKRKHSSKDGCFFYQ